MMLSDICLSDVCLSVAYIGPKSRIERPRKSKIGTEVVHVTFDSDTTFKVKGQLVADVLNSQHAGELCGEFIVQVLASINWTDVGDALLNSPTLLHGRCAEPQEGGGPAWGWTDWRPEGV